MVNDSDIIVDEGEREPEEDGKPSFHYWLSQLEAYDNAADSWKRDIDRAWDEYLNSEGRGRNSDSRKASTHFPLFWACVRTIQPAFYSRPPVIVTEKFFKEQQDPIARLSAVCLERLGKYAVKTSGFDRTMSLSVTHFIMSEKASNRVIFESAIKKTKKYYQAAEQVGPDGQPYMQLSDDSGQPFTGEYEQDDEGYFSTEEDIEHLSCETEPLHYKDYRHTPNARHWGEVDWISFDTLLTRKEVEKTFGQKVANELSYSPVGNAKDKDRKKEIKGLPASFATISEIWDKKKRRVYYLCKGYNGWLKHENNPNGEDPYKLKDFFPCPPFMLGTYGADDMFTVPAYIQLVDFIEQVHGAFDRIRRLILALKKAGVFDASKPELAELNSIADEGQFIGIDDLDTLLGPNGSLDKLIHFFPTEKIAQGVSELKTAMLELEQKVYDLWGIPDIYRGITDPNETLGAQQLKGKHMSVRFSVLQRDVQRLARDTIELMCDLLLAKCPDMKLAEIMGYRFMSPQEQQIFPQALQLLKSDTERCIRIDIETDSTITQNLNADIEQKNYLAKTFFDGVAALKDLNPIFLPVGAKALQLGINSLQQGKQIEGELEQSIQMMLQNAANPPPPPPDPEMMKIQGRMQIEQQRAQAQIAIEQQKTQAQIQQDSLLAQNQMALDQQQGMIDAQLAKMKAELEAMRIQQSMAVEQQKAQLDAELQRQQAEYDIIVKRMELEMKAKQALVDSLLTKLQESESSGGSGGAGGKSSPARLRIETGKAPRVAKIQRGDDGSVTVLAEDVD